ncbi:MAG: hypothetical protein ACXAC7_06980 [Candidatus Hodarchaeales archaeon]|jgi:hypothetical protein
MSKIIKIASIILLVLFLGSTAFELMTIKNEESSSFKNNQVLSFIDTDTDLVEKNSPLFAIQQEDESPSYSYAFDTKFKTNSSRYYPGESVVINSTSSSNGFNGTATFSLTTPLDEDVFAFERDASRVFFDDPAFENESVSDWENHTTNAFANIEVESGRLNLTTNTDSSIAIASYNKYLDIVGSFDITLNYAIQETDEKSNLTFSHWNGTNYESLNLTIPEDYGITNYQLVSEKITINNTVDAPNGLFFFNLTGSEAKWLLKPLLLSYSIDRLDLTTGEEGSIDQIWVHGVPGEILSRENLSISYNVSTTVGEMAAFTHFEIQLPENNLYLGDWLFKLVIIPIDQSENELPRIDYIIPIRVTDNITFSPVRQFLLRGTNSTTNFPIYEDETNITTIYSPGDNITLIGQISSNSTGTLFNSEYFSDLNGELLSNTTGTANLELLWGNSTDELGAESSLRSNNPLAQDLAHGNFSDLSDELKTNTSWLVNYRIPKRGIYGSAAQELILSFPSFITINASNNVIYGDDFDLVIDLNPITIKFIVNITSETLPFNRDWIITEFMEGEISLKSMHYNNTNLTSIYNEENRTINWELDIPFDDLSLSIYLIEENTNAEKAQELDVNLISDKYIFSGKLDSNLDTSKTYELHVQWIAPKDVNDDSIANLEFTSGNIEAIYPIRGTLTVELPFDEINVIRGRNLRIDFNISIDQLNREATGLNLYAVLGNSVTKTLIYEQDGTYSILETISFDTSLDRHTFTIYKESTNEVIGTISFNVLQEPASNVETKVPDIYTVFGSIIAIIIIAGFILGIIQVRPKN